ncbi:hypothetical protein ABN028_33185 [Actinopolymorpha sp. B17G11]|uniref:hypothetical protein n=1 Tax=Actinopolymorpha sp. B17G11 TaxID=3160861 RepID=UPI0032E38746
MAARLWFYWLACGLLPEGRYWLSWALRTDQEATWERARALWVNGWIMTLQGEATAATAVGEQIREAARRLGDDAAFARGTRLIALSAILAADLPRARAVLPEALGLLEVEVAKQPPRGRPGHHSGAHPASGRSENDLRG